MSDRLLTDEERRLLIIQYGGLGDSFEVTVAHDLMTKATKAQDAKTASIKDTEYKAKIRKMAEHIAKRTGQLTQTKIELQRVRQEMVEEIRQFIEDYHTLIPRKFDLKYNTHSHPDCNILRVFDDWQELKRKCGILPVNPVGCGGDS